MPEETVVAPAASAQAAPSPAPAPAPAPAQVTPSPSPSNVVKLDGQTTPPESVDPFASLKAENKQVIEKSGFKTLDAIVESYSSLRNELRNKGMLGDLPKDATPEQRLEWNRSRGAPEIPANYSLSMPQDMPKDMPY